MEDEKKKTFIIEEGTFCYTRIHFGLKNVGATLQRLVVQMFELQVGQNIEVYTDDIMVKTRILKDHKYMR